MVEEIRAAASTGTIEPTNNFTDSGVVNTAAIVETVVIMTAQFPRFTHF
jgi:hypothetical protein